MNQTTTNPYQIKEMPKYPALRDVFLNSLRMLEQQGIIHSLTIDKEFERTQDVAKMACFVSDTYAAEALAKKLPYSEKYDCKLLPLISCELTGVEDFSISLGVAMTAGEYLNADSAMGLAICSRCGDQVFKQQYRINRQMYSVLKAASATYSDINDSFINFQMILDNVRQLQKEKAE